jgi:hypothetical protein
MNNRKVITFFYLAAYTSVAHGLHFVQGAQHANSARDVHDCHFEESKKW